MTEHIQKLEDVLCPLCGKPVSVHKHDDISVWVYGVGCVDCGLMRTSYVSSFAHSNLTKEHILETTLMKDWEDSIQKDETLKRAVSENVLRTAYGMDPITYSDYLYRDLEREHKGANKGSM